MNDNGVAYTEEMMQQVRTCQSVEEVIALGRENGMEISEELAYEYLKMLAPVYGEIEDEELDNVAGGGCKTKVNGKNYTVVTSYKGCFTGRWEKVKNSNGGWKRSDNNFLRETWYSNSNNASGNQCGNCMHLEFKGGTGYCGVSA